MSTPATSIAEPSADDALRTFLRGRDVECPACGYNVRDLIGDRCPECDEALMVSLRLQEPKQAALITGLVGLSAGAGLGGLLLIYWFISIVVLRRGFGRGWVNEFTITNAAGLTAHALMLVLWIRNWNRIRRAQPWLRRMLVLACLAMPLVFIVIFSIAVR